MTAASNQRGRFVLACALAAFVGAQLALLGLLELCGPGLSDPEFGEKLSRLHARLAQAPGRPLLLMLGSSRTLQGFQAQRLDGLPAGDGRPCLAFNFGLTGAGPLRAWPCLCRLLDAGIRPEVLLIEILPPLLNEPGPARMSEESWLAVPRLAAADVARLGAYHSRPGWLYRTWGRSRLLPCYTHRLPLLHRLAAAWLPPPPGAAFIAPMDRLGWQPFARADVTPEFRRTTTANVERQYRDAFANFRVGGGTRRALGDLLERCRRERIAASLVLMPEGSDFRRRYSPEMAAAVQDFLSDLCGTYGARLIDARDWVADADFYDSHHLLPGGAAVFSERLAGVVCRTPREEWSN